MSQPETDKALAARGRSQETRTFVRTVKAAARRTYTPEEKIRIVLEGFRREATVRDRCRREGIKPHSCYSWTKEFMEAGKERLTRDSVRDATRDEVHQFKRENGEFKQLVVDLSLDVCRLKKRPYPCLRAPALSADEWRREGGGADQGSPSPLPKRRVLRALNVPRSTYERWLKRKDQHGLEDDAGGGKPPIEPTYFPGSLEGLVGSRGDAGDELPSAGCLDHRPHGLLRSESRVYRILRREGLVKRPEMRLAAGKEYHHKTAGPHWMWATDASSFRVVGWGYSYLVTVMDDYSRFILAHKLQRDMTSDSFIAVVQEAVDQTGMDRVPIADRARLLSDNGPGYVSRAFRDYLGLVGIKNILASPFHPRTNGKLERYHQTLKRDVNQLPYEMPSDLEAAIAGFVSYYNYRRYHKALGNVTPSDVLRGKREDILRRRREVQARTVQRRRQHNRALRELTRPPFGP